MYRITTSRRQRGLSLIESAVATAIVATIASLAAPSMSKVEMRTRVIAVAAEFETDVQLARSAATQGNATVRMQFGSSDAGACYLIHTGDAADCRCSADAAPVCSEGVQLLREVRLPARSGLTVNANVRAIVFDPIAGTSTPAGSFSITARDGQALRQVVNIMGRVRSCSPSRTLVGYKAC